MGNGNPSNSPVATPSVKWGLIAGNGRFPFLVLEGGQAAMKEAFRESQFWYLLANLFLVLHLTVTLSVYLRWGALAMALTLTVGSMIFSVVAIELTMQWSSQMRSLSQQAFGLMAVLILCACLSCHLAVLLRIPVLGEK